MENLPIIAYLREVLDEHTLPLEDNNAGIIEARWLVDLIQRVEQDYRNNGLL